MGIRLANEGDLPAIVAVYNAAVPGRMATGDVVPVSVDSRREWFRARLPERHPVWVDDREGAVAGWLSLGTFYARPAWNGTAEVSVYVSPGWQRAGVARGLLDHAMAEAPALGLHALVGLIFGHNEPSLGLFQGAGFEVWGRMPMVVELDGVLRDVVIVGRYAPQGFR